MKKIKRLLENIEALMTLHHWERYSLVISNQKIGLKLTPKKDGDSEMNWIIDKNKEGINDLNFQIEEMINNGEY